MLLRDKQTDEIVGESRKQGTGGEAGQKPTMQSSFVAELPLLLPSVASSCFWPVLPPKTGQYMAWPMAIGSVSVCGQALA